MLMSRVLSLCLLVIFMLAGEPPPDCPLTLHDAITVALENNPQLRMIYLAPESNKMLAEIRKSKFDPRVQLEATRGTITAQPIGPPESKETAHSSVISAMVNETFPSGTTISVGVTGNKGPNPWAYQAWTGAAYAETRAGISVTQALLKGGSVSANMADIRQAQLDVKVSTYEVRAFVANLVADIERYYWDTALADQEVGIFETSCQISSHHIEEIRTMISSGMLSDSDLIAAEAELSSRQSGLIDARARREGCRIGLARLMGVAIDKFDKLGVRTIEAPFVPASELFDVDDHIALAIKRRPDINQALLLLKRGELNIVKTQDGLLPQLDVVFTTGRTGYADRLSGSLRSEDGYGWDASIGVRFSQPVGNRSAESEDRRARIEQRQLILAIDNLRNAINADVRISILEVGRARSQIDAMTTSEKLYAEKYRIERERLSAGKTTTINVAQADRDQLQSSLNRARSVSNLLLALTNLQRVDGSLLDRRGINVFGDKCESAP